MSERPPASSRDWIRTNYCSSLGLEHEGKRVTLFGWVHRRRDHGGLIFVDLRDRTGLVQLVFHPEQSLESHARAQDIRNEFVVGIKGVVTKRPEGTANPNLPTGKVEVVVEELRILNECKPLPFSMDEGEVVDEAVRLRYRFLDLRRPELQQKFIIRHQVLQEVRAYLSGQGFLEVETPFLTKSTPEGARDYLVPSRTSPGCFFALPQSPQLFKQLLMVSGFDRYFQVVRCFRDEDLRADRQPEFTQIDIEMSFWERDELFQVVEGMLAGIFERVKGIRVPTPFPRLTYAEAVSRFGLDSPDVRFGLELVDLTEGAAQADFPPFKKVITERGVIKGINLAGHQLSRKELEGLADDCRSFGVEVLSWIKVSSGQWASGAASHFPAPAQEWVSQKLALKEGHLLLMAGGAESGVNEALGRVRVKLAKKFGLLAPDQWRFLWITDFPLLEFSREEGRFVSKHHPFTSPVEEDIAKLKTKPEEVRARAYDIVLNGTEIGGGSIRIHRRDVQEMILETLGLDKRAAEEKFGFLLEALEYGAPPHGGIALGLDRIVMMMVGASSLRDVIAFPKTSKGMCLLTGAPDKVSAKQLQELSLKHSPKK